MVGEGVLHECLLHPYVEQVLVINRTSCEISNPKLTEIIHGNLFDLSLIENRLTGYDACFYCIGTISPLVKESEYYNITFKLTLSVAGRLAALNPQMIFCYVSGFGADTTARAKFIPARIKGMTESSLFKLPFKKVYSFRPGLMKPTKGLKRFHKVYYLFNPFYPVFRLILPGFILTLRELGLAMINSVLAGYPEQILEVKDIVSLAETNKFTS